jgi:hypothetical protein
VPLNFKLLHPWEILGNSSSLCRALIEGYVTLDTTYPRDNLPRALRFKSLTEQVLADERIRKRLHERFRRKQERPSIYLPNAPSATDV